MPDEVALASKTDRLRDVARRLFALNGHPEHPIVTETPSYVQYAGGSPFDLDDLRELLFAAIQHLDLDEAGVA